MNPTDRLKYHVTGAIERGEKQAIVEQRPEPKRIESDDGLVALISKTNSGHFNVEIFNPAMEEDKSINFTDLITEGEAEAAARWGFHCKRSERPRRRRCAD